MFRRDIVLYILLRDFSKFMIVVEQRVNDITDFDNLGSIPLDLDLIPSGDDLALGKCGSNLLNISVLDPQKIDQGYIF